MDNRAGKLARFEEKYIPEPNSGCWLWMAAGGRYYGRLGWGKRWLTIAAHRAAWELFRGPIPEGMKVLHKCDVTWCVNPDHLFLGTQRDNVYDCMAKGRRAHLTGERHGRAKVTREQVEEIRNSPLASRKIAPLYGLGPTQIKRIRKGEHWR